MRKARGWLMPYIRSRECRVIFIRSPHICLWRTKCNIDVARRSMDCLHHNHGCRVLALMGGEPLLRLQMMAHKIVNGF